MRRYVIRRLLETIPTLFGVSLLSFSLLYIFPGDPAEIILAAISGSEPSTKEIRIFRKKLGLDKPLVVQYFHWLINVLHGNFGTSWTEGKPVMQLIMERFPVTAELFFSSFLISVAFAILLGVISVIYKDRALDHIIRIFSLLGVSIPSFWLGLVLIYVFSVKLHLLPAFGFGGIRHLILPVITWSFSFMAIKTRFIRSCLLDEMGKQYIVTARAKGLKEEKVVLRHAFRNALIPIVTYLSLSIHHLIIGSVMVEIVFSLPGLGTLLVQSVFNRDFPVVQALVFLSGVLFVFVNLIVDIAYAFIDPRVRYGD